MSAVEQFPGWGVPRDHVEAEAQRMVKGRTIYLAGPMSGYPEYNYPAFREAAERIRKTPPFRDRVVSPAEMDSPEHTPGDWPWHRYMRRDLRALLDCDTVAVLPGWRDSKGASLEVYVAAALGMPILDVDTLAPVIETPLQEAGRLVHGSRQADYGHPFDDFSKTATMWTAILRDKLRETVEPEDVALCMVAVKISREVNRPKRDNIVDGMGYFETLHMVRQERARRHKPPDDDV